MTEKDIRPIPKYMEKLIWKKDKEFYPDYYGQTRYYAYLTKYRKELVKVTVAVKSRGKQWFCKQVAVHGIHSEYCLVKDIEFFILAGYVVGWYEQGLTKYRKWYETGKWCQAYDKYFNLHAPIINKEYALKFQEFRYSAVTQYPYTDIIKYLRLYEKYPQAEMLVKFGLPEYATSVQILRKVCKDKAFRKWLINKRDEIKNGNYYVGTLLIAYRTGKPLKQVQILEEQKKSFYRQDGYRNIKQLFKTDKEVTELLEYISKQKTSLSSYSDYLYACNYLGLDMIEEKNKLPHDFKRWHDIRIDEYHTAKALKDEEELKVLYDKFRAIAEKYMSLQKSNNDYAVIIAKSPAELIHEGNILNHCVGRMNYDQRFIREESLIFFVRNSNEIDTPFVTVEYSIAKHKVLQCYGYNDSKPNDEVLHFVNKVWLPKANQELKKLIA